MLPGFQTSSPGFKERDKQADQFTSAALFQRSIARALNPLGHHPDCPSCIGLAGVSSLQNMSSLD